MSTGSDGPMSQDGADAGDGSADAPGDEDRAPGVEDGKGPRRRRPSTLTWITIAFGLGAVAMGALAVSLLGEDEGPSTVDISGTIVVVNEGYAGQDGTCEATMGDGDQLAGTVVLVTDGDGAQLGTGTVQLGRRARLFECRFDFRVEQVGTAANYTVTVGDTGTAVTMSDDELAAAGYEVTLAMGGLSG